MRGFILEILAGRTWRREGTTFWTHQAAQNEAKLLLCRGKAQEIRILPVDVDARAIESLSRPACQGKEGGADHA
jgi:hypothetical protein